MKAKNLELLKNNGIRVPEFIVVESEEKIDLSFSDSAFFAVRSSAAAEDSAEHSYAGQFESLLDVPRDRVPEAVKKVLDSVGNSNVAAYEQKEAGQEEGRTEIRVIIQKMLHPELSGVLFTANPAGILNETVVTAGKGLGEGVVRDEVPTTTCFYNRDDGKSLLIEEAGGPEIPEGLTEELSQLGQQIETLLKTPADVEFAVEAGTLFILQARPITTLPKGAAPIVLDSSNIVESYPGISLPVTQDFAKDIYYHVFQNCLLRLSKDKALVESMDENLRHMVDTANGRIYYRISSWYDILELLPFSEKIIEVWQNSLGVKNRLVVSDRVKAGFGTKIRIFFSFCRYILSCPRDMRKLNTYFGERIGPLREELSRTETLPALSQLYRKLLLEITEKWDITLVNDVWTFIFTALSGKKSRERLADVGSLESMKPALAFSALTERYREEGESEAFRTAFDEYINLYGDRCPEDLKLETRTMRTDPDLLMKLVKETEPECGAENKHGNESAALKDEEAAPGSANAAQKDEENNPGSAADGQKKPAGGLFLRRAKQGIANREISRMNRSRLFGVMREIILKSGRILATEGRIAEPRDVMYLRLPEIFGENMGEANALVRSSMQDSGQKDTVLWKAARRDGAPSDAAPQDLKELVAARKEEEADERALPAFERLVFAGQIVNHRERGKKQESGNAADTLTGIPVSFGKAEGEVLIVRDPKSVSDTSGKILVTVSTDPGWVHILRGAAGIIAERGSILSHTAIIARELKKPSIVNVGGATESLHDGDIVSLDTETGIVRILRRVK